MQCPNCGADNREDRRFCAECGGVFSLACPVCGFRNEPGEKFCGGCGTALVPPSAQATKPALQPQTQSEAAPGAVFLSCTALRAVEWVDEVDVSYPMHIGRSCG